MRTNYVAPGDSLFSIIYTDKATSVRIPPELDVSPHPNPQKEMVSVGLTKASSQVSVISVCPGADEALFE